MDFFWASLLQCTQPETRKRRNFTIKDWLFALSGFSLRGFWEVRVFPFCGGKKGLRLPLAVGMKGLRLPRSSCSDLGNEGVSDPFSQRKSESQTLFPTEKGKTCTSPNPLCENPLSANRVKKESKRLKKSWNFPFSTLFWTFWPRGRKAPGTHFQLRFQLWARRAQELSQRAQLLKNFKIALRDWNFSSEIETNEIFKRDWKFQVSRPPNPYFCGDFSRSRLKISSEIEVFKRDWTFQAKAWSFHALNAMIARIKWPSRPPNAVIAKRRNRGETPNAIIAKERQPRLLI